MTPVEVLGTGSGSLGFVGDGVAVAGGSSGLKPDTWEGVLPAEDLLRTITEKK